MNKVLERLEAIEANQVRIMELLGAKSSRADYQKRYYAKRKAAKAMEAVKARGKFRNPDRNNLTLRFGKDRRLFAKFMEWGRVGLKFGAQNQPSRFLEWLCCGFGRHGHHHHHHHGHHGHGHHGGGHHGGGHGRR